MMTRGATTPLTRCVQMLALAALFLLPLMVANSAVADEATVEAATKIEMGKPLPPGNGFCRNSCGVQCDTSDDCPNGEPCDPFDSCPGGIDGDALPSLEEQLDPQPASVRCPFGAPSCFKDDHCDAYCGDPRFGVCSSFCCLCSG